MSSPILEIRDLCKRYKTVDAVRGVSFAIPAGICFGLLGPNGAGKTTTIEMMEGITEPSSGEIFYKGQPLGAQFKQEAGIQFQHTELQDYLTVQENLQLFASFYDQPVPLARLIELCSLQAFINSDAKKLSGGQKQRLLLAIALVNDPDIVFLDEPTTGLDPQARRNFWDLVNLIKRQGKTIILTTHYMEEADLLCDDIAIMDHGKLIARGTPKALLSQHFDDMVLRLPLDTLLPSSDLKITRQSDALEISVKDLQQAVSVLDTSNINLRDIQIRPRTLEDLFISLTGKALRH